MASRNRVVDKDHGFAAMLKAASELARGAYVQVGILGGSDDRGGLHKTDAEGNSLPLTIAEIAVVNEFGTEDGHIPARPAHRMTFDQQRETITRTAAKLLVKVVIARTMTVEAALNVLGLQHATAIKRTITSGAGVPPPNAPSTIAAKVPKSSRGKKRQKAIDGNQTLVNTNTTLNALSWATFLGTVQKTHRYLTGRGK